MASINLHNASVRFPIYDARHRSFKNRMLGNTSSSIFNSSKDKFYIDAITNLTLELQAGDRVAVLGGNGSGKTTLLRTLAGLLVPNQGSISIKGHAMPVFNIGFGYNPDATVLDTIRLKGFLMGLSETKIGSIANQLAEFTNLGNELNQPLNVLPIGQVFRLGIAMSFFFEAEIILFDEVLETQDHEYI